MHASATQRWCRSLLHRLLYGSRAPRQHITGIGKVLAERRTMAGRIQAKLWEIALDQHGFVTSRDARALGINVVELGKLSHRHQLEHVGYGIYRFPQLPATPLDAY